MSSAINRARTISLSDASARELSLNREDIREVAAALLKRWDPSWLFVATPDGFFCAPSSAVAEHGTISRLSENWVPVDRQKQYLDLLNEFETR